MKACFFLLRYMMTWSRPLFWLVCLGLVLLCSVPVLGILGLHDIAFAMAVYSFVPLAIPYLLVWRPFRIMLSCRRLALLPGFRRQLGSVLLLYTVLLSVFLPAAAFLFLPNGDADIADIRTVALIFIAASLYTLIVQWAVASPKSVMIFSLGPVLIFYLLIKIGPLVLLVFYRKESAFALLIAAALGWVLALNKVVSQRTFRPPSKAPLHARDYVWDGRSDWLGILLMNYRGAVKSAQGTLLLGYPDGGQLYQLLVLTVISPLFGMLILYLTNMAPQGDLVGPMEFFLGYSLFANLIGGFGNGERAARWRLVWLREGGDRLDHWQRIERRIYSDLVLLAFIVLPITGVALMFPDISFDALTYCVMALTGNILASYFSLAARLSQWSMFLQIPVALATGASLVVARVLDVLPMPVVVLIVLGLAALFRVLAKQRFTTVDWHLLRPAGLGYKSKLA